MNRNSSSSDPNVFGLQRRPTLRSKMSRLGGASADIIQNYLLPPLLNSLNVRVTSDENELKKSVEKNALEVVTVVDPEITSAARLPSWNIQCNDLLTSLLCNRQNMSTRRNSSLSESVFLRTLKEPAGSQYALSQKSMPTGRLKRTVPIRSKPIYRTNLTNSNDDVDRLSALPKEKHRAFDKSQGECGAGQAPGALCPETLEKLSPKGADLISSRMAVAGGVAARLAEVKAREKEAKMVLHHLAKIKKKKKKKNMPPPKIKVNLRNFKQRVSINGTDYVMEMYLSKDVIEDTRKRNIDATKEPLIRVNYSRAADLRDEFSTYCGQRKSIKNWLFYV